MSDAKYTEADVSSRDHCFEKERAAFEENYRRVLDLTMAEDSWGRPKYIHSHVDALFTGWMARAPSVEVGDPSTVILPADTLAKVRDALGKIAALPIEQFGMRDPGKPLHGWNDYRLTVGDIINARNALSLLAAAQKQGEG